MYILVKDECTEMMTYAHYHASQVKVIPTVAWREESALSSEHQ